MSAPGLASRSAEEPLDLLVVGGGINGTGIARDATGRGLSVLLCEQADLGGGTSSRSSKLIHGGLRYLEYFEFRLVREALIEREVLLRAAPHIVWPMRFVLPHSPEQRPAWMIRLGLFLYDHLGRRQVLPGTRRLNLRRVPEGAPVDPAFTAAFEYSDCWVEDSRLVVLNALDAQNRGAEVLVRTAVVSARRDGELWHATLRTEEGGTREVRARALVNAAGPWVERVLRGVAGSNTPARVRLVKGSHLVVRKFWDGPQAYLLQNTDKRVIFVIPFEDDLALIGTTDTPYDGDPAAVAIDEAERDYLLAAVNRYLHPKLSPADVQHSFSGVRPLFDDNSGKSASAVTRDYVFDVEAGEGRAPLLSVFGGKITTYRKLAEHALEKLAPHLPKRPGPAWTAHAPLPGGAMPGADPAAYLKQLLADRPWLEAAVARSYVRAYGTRAEELLEGARDMADLGRFFGGGLYEREAEFLRRTEWARTAADVLERRTRRGLHMSPAERDAFTAWMG
ncbi:glycerol-3-phosphate dehydrogenase [Roseomonas sp. BN140053]|uniref:glycerol-3-phosphate dehydrogenase n=1 Tax=Roseomonas sp. BN140053 TaxID=3391898 RepID=UPI0039EA40A6